jgi:YegS/Rv2252/BmrU family lipid kinase
VTEARRITLIVNPAAGGGRAARALPAVQARLSELAVDVDTQTTRDLVHARDLARAAAHDGRVAVTLSGDGLVGTVAGALREVPGAVLGVLPGGRGNDFARMAGIPQDPVQACEVIADGEARAIDLGAAGEVTFVCIASLGIDSEANRLANEAPSAMGRLAYLYAALRAVAGWRHAAFAVEVDGERVAFRGWSVAAANSGAYGGGMILAPDASITDGVLDVVLTGATSKRRFLRVFPKLFKGEHVHDPAIRVLRGAEVRVSADRPFVVYADGEPVGGLPITLRALPAALQVLLPARASGA